MSMDCSKFMQFTIFCKGYDFQETKLECLQFYDSSFTFYMSVMAPTLTCDNSYKLVYIYDENYNMLPYFTTTHLRQY